MNKKIIGIFVFMLLVGTILPVTGNVIADNKNENTLFDSDGESGKFKWGFIIGPIGSKEWEGDILVIRGTKETRGRLHFIIPFLWKELWLNKQIKIQFKFGILRNDFIIGFSKIYVPKSELSMHIVSHNDSNDEVIWEVDEIIGDPIWENNINIRLFNMSGDRYHRFQYGPLVNEYLSVGDQIRIQLDKPVSDEYYKVQFIDGIFENVLFEMNSVKF